MKYFLSQFENWEAIRKKLFSFCKFYAQWKKFSLCGLIFSITFLEGLLREQTDVIESEDFSNTNEMLKAMSGREMENTKIYLERIVAITTYYFNLTEK